MIGSTNTDTKSAELLATQRDNIENTQYASLCDRHIALMQTDDGYLVSYITKHILSFSATGYCRALLRRGYPKDLIIHILKVLHSKTFESQFFYGQAHSAEEVYEIVINGYGL